MVKVLSLVSALLALTLSVSSYGSSGGAHWTYDGHAGPENWGSLAPEYAACGNGREQSPIDIRDARADGLKPIKTGYKSTPLDIVNNGHTIQVNNAAESVAVLAGHEYKLAQFHFHAPSEHLINGRSYPMELHLVHKDPSGKLAVIGLLFKEGKESAFLERFWSKLPQEAEQKKRYDSLDVNVADLLPADMSYFHYAGSLTTPPCTEGVKWFVLKEQVSASRKQIEEFAKLFGHNERPPQPLNGRSVVLVSGVGGGASLGDTGGMLYVWLGAAVVLVILAGAIWWWFSRANTGTSRSTTAHESGLFGNMTVKMKLVGLIGFLSVLLIAIGIIGLRGIGSSNDKLMTIYNDRLVPAGQLAMINKLQSENQRQVHLMLMHDPRLPESKLHDHPLSFHTDKMAENRDRKSVV
jgi:carbonic anhydrase